MSLPEWRPLPPIDRARQKAAAAKGLADARAALEASRPVEFTEPPPRRPAPPMPARPKDAAA